MKECLVHVCVSMGKRSSTMSEFIEEMRDAGVPPAAPAAVLLG